MYDNPTWGRQRFSGKRGFLRRVTMCCLAVFSCLKLPMFIAVLWGNVFSKAQLLQNLGQVDVYTAWSMTNTHHLTSLWILHYYLFSVSCPRLATLLVVFSSRRVMGRVPGLSQSSTAVLLAPCSVIELIPLCCITVQHHPSIPRWDYQSPHTIACWVSSHYIHVYVCMYARVQIPGCKLFSSSQFSLSIPVKVVLQGW